MNEMQQKLITEWLLEVDPVRVADMGSLDINGGLRLFWDGVVGFDLQPGKGVDVALVNGIVPLEYRQRFDAVIANGSYQFAPDPDAFLATSADLLCRGGKMLLTMCPPHCQNKHTTGEATKDVTENRESLASLAERCSRWFALGGAWYHQDKMNVYWGTKK